MSAGRKRLNLADMQAAARDGFAAQVATMVLPGSVAAPVERRRPDAEVGAQPLEPRRMGRNVPLDWHVLGKPADRQYRTTPQDVLAAAIAMAEDRLPLHLVSQVPLVVEGRDFGLTTAEREQIAAMVLRCRVAYMRGLAKTPGKRTTHHGLKRRPRTDGPCSAVVTRMADGRMFVDGFEVDEILPTDFLPVED